MIFQEPEVQHSEKESMQVDAGCEDRIAHVPMMMYLQPHYFLVDRCEVHLLKSNFYDLQEDFKTNLLPRILTETSSQRAGTAKTAMVENLPFKFL